MTFSKKVLTAYANKGRNEPVDANIKWTVPFFILFSAIFYYISTMSWVRTLIITIIFLLLYFLEKSILSIKHKLTDGYNFLYVSLSFGVLSLFLLITSCECIFSVTSFAYVLTSVLFYLFICILFYVICIYNLTKLTVEKIENNNAKSSARYIPIPFVSILAIRRFLLINPALLNRQKGLIFCSIVLFALSVLAGMATAGIIKFIIIKKLKL